MAEKKIPKYYFFRILIFSFFLYFLLVGPINSYLLIKELPTLAQTGIIKLNNNDTLQSDSLKFSKHHPIKIDHTENNSNISFRIGSSSDTEEHSSGFASLLILVIFILLIVFSWRFKTYFRRKRKNKAISEKLEKFVKKYILKTPYILSGAILLTFIIGIIEDTINYHYYSNKIDQEFAMKVLTISIFSTALLLLFIYFWQRHRVRYKYIDYIFTHSELNEIIKTQKDARIRNQLMLVQLITTLLPLSVTFFYLYLSFSFPSEIISSNLNESEIKILLGSYSTLLKDLNIVVEDLSFVKFMPYVNSFDTAFAMFGVICGIIVSIIYVIFFIKWFNYQLTQPIFSLIANMDNFGKNNSYHKIHIRTNDEFGKLTSGYNFMSEKISNYIDEIKNINENLELKVMERTAEIEAQRDEIEAQRDEIIAQRDYTIKQRDLIEIQKKEILDSINYAYRIQNAILPPEKYLSKCLNQYFIFYRPKDVVSGDFYFVEKIDNKVIFAAVDCTGHGVPGAMMSVIGYNLLNQAVKINSIYKPSEILKFLDIGVTETLRQTYGESGVNDGMDISLCCINLDTNILEYAGAYNSMYLVRSKKTFIESDFINNNLTKSKDAVLIEIKADKFPIGVNYTGQVDNYTNSNFKLFKDDIVYLFSDGFADQFGGPNHKKYKYKPLRDLFLSVYNKDIELQKNIIETSFNDWKGNLEQIDDVLIFGVKI